MVCLVPSLPATLFAHPFPRHVRQCLAPIKSSLTSRSLGLPLPSLPTTLFAHPFPRHVHQCLAPIKSSLTSRSLGLPCPISARHLVCSPFPQTCSPGLGSYQVFTHLKIAWFASSHLCPPPCLLTLSPDMFTSAWLLSSPCSPQDHLVCFFPSAPTTSFAHPPHTGFFYMAGWLGGRFMDGLGAH